jgi:hypothetical protein
MKYGYVSTCNDGTASKESDCAAHDIGCDTGAATNYEERDKTRSLYGRDYGIAKIYLTCYKL